MNPVCYLFPFPAICISRSISHGLKEGLITGAVPSGSTTLPRSAFSLSYVLGELGLCVVVISNVLLPGADVTSRAEMSQLT